MMFSDGMKFDTSGKYRTVKRSDGLYVVGNGLLCPVDDWTEARNLIKSLTRKPTVLVDVVPDTEDSVRRFIYDDTDLMFSETSQIIPDKALNGVWKVTDMVSPSGIVGSVIVYLAGYKIAGTDATRKYSDFECSIEVESVDE